MIQKRCSRRKPASEVTIAGSRSWVSSRGPHMVGLVWVRRARNEPSVLSPPPPMAIRSSQIAIKKMVPGRLHEPRAVRHHDLYYHGGKRPAGLSVPSNSARAVLRLRFDNQSPSGNTAQALPASASRKTWCSHSHRLTTAPVHVRIISPRYFKVSLV